MGRSMRLLTKKRSGVKTSRITRSQSKKKELEKDANRDGSDIEKEDENDANSSEESTHEDSRNKETRVRVDVHDVDENANGGARRVNNPKIFTYPSLPSLNGDEMDAGVAMVQSLLHQNQLLIEMFKDREKVSDKKNEPRITQIIPDLHKGTSKYDGEGGELKAEMWMKEIQAKKKMHGWSDDLGLQFAYSKLSDGAKQWFLANQKDIKDWDDFVQKFQRTFMGHLKLTDKYKRMLDRKQGKDETVNAYIFSKYKLCNDLNLAFEEVKEEIVLGLKSKSLSDELASLKLNDLDELIGAVRKSEKRAERRQDFFSPLSNSKNKEVSSGHVKSTEECSKGKSVSLSKTEKADKNSVKCYKCGKKGHLSPECPEKEPKCFKCNLFGHKSDVCPNPKAVQKCYNCEAEGHISRDCPEKRKKDGNKESSKDMGKNPSKDASKDSSKVKQNVISVSQSRATGHNKYVKSCLISNNEIKCLIDTGSTSCTMAKSVADRLGLKYDQSEIEIFGFGDVNKPVAKTVGKINSDLIIDNVSGSVELLIVPDGVQPSPLMIGRTWTEQPHIAMLKKDDTLYFGRKDDFPFKDIDMTELRTKITLRAVEDEHIEKNIVSWIRVKSDDISNGDILTNDGILVSLKDGETFLPVATINRFDQSIKANEVVTRGVQHVAVCMNELNVDECFGLNESNERAEILTVNAMYERQVGMKRPIRRDEVNVDETIDDEQRNDLLALLNEFKMCFATSMDEIGRAPLEFAMPIELESGVKPFQSKPYRASPKQREQINEIVADWKRNGIVRESNSPYASPVILIPKKTGEFRLVVDFRKLNAQTTPMNFPLPDVDDLLQELSDSKIFSILDLAQGYNQFPLKEEAKAKTAFITQDETGEFEYVCFGLKNAPVFFQKVLKQILAPLREKFPFLVNFFDDMLVHSITWADMLNRLRLLFDRLKQYNLTLRLDKCHFGKREIEFLGFRISSEGIKPGLNKVHAIKLYPRPQNVRDVQAFLGLCSFFRRFVKGFATIAEPLSRLTRNNQPFIWNKEQIDAFEMLKDRLTSEPIVKIYNPKARTELHTDASSKGLSGMLFQEGKDGKLHLVYCVSRRTSDTERNYHSSKLELIAIIWSVQRLRSMLISITFTIFSDCQALMYLNSQKTLNPQIARWYIALQEFRFEIKHRAGEKMAHVDALSRYPVGDAEERNEMMLVVAHEDAVAVMQRQDESVQVLIRLLQQDPNLLSASDKNLVKDFELVDGRLFRRVGGRLLFVIPKTMRKSVLVNHHDILGHFGIERTMQKIREHFWFSNMKRYVRNHVNSCITCILTKKPRGKQRGLLHPIPTATRPFAVLNIDHLGPFVISSRKNQFVLTIIDNFTKFIHVYAVRSTDSDAVIRCLKNFILLRGNPEVIIHDKGSAFISDEYKEFLRSNGIQPVANSTSHPQANGQVERVHGTLTPLIMSYIKRDDHSDWDLHLKEVQRDYNAAVNASTGRSPFELLHGYKPIYTLPVLINELGSVNNEYTPPTELREEAREKIKAAQAKMKARYDRSHLPGLRYSVGDVVYMKCNPPSGQGPTKTAPRYRGPLTISEILPNDTYRVVDLLRKAGRLYTTTAHTSQLKFWKLHGDDESFTDSDDNDSSDAAETNFDALSHESEVNTDSQSDDDSPNRSFPSPIPTTSALTQRTDVTVPFRSDGRPQRERKPNSRFRDYVPFD